MGKQDDILSVLINRPLITEQQEFGWPGDIPANGKYLIFFYRLYGIMFTCNFQKQKPSPGLALADLLKMNYQGNSQRQFTV